MTTPPEPGPDDATFARYSTLFRRIGAGVVDGCLLFSTYKLAEVCSPGSELAWYVLQLSFGFAWTAYSILMTRFWGGTLGKLALGVRVFDLREASYPSLWHVLIRDLYWIISMLVIAGATTWRMVHGLHPVWAYDFQFEQTCGDTTWLVVDAAFALGSLKRRALHDMMAGTVVVVVRRGKPTAPAVAQPPASR